MVARLVEAVRRGEPTEILEAGRLVSSTLLGGGREVEEVVRTATTVLESMLLGMPEGRTAQLCARLEAAIAEVEGLRRVADGDVPGLLAAVLDAMWSDLARLIAEPAEAQLALEEQVQHYLARHLSGRVTLKELARALGYSPSHVSTVIRRVAGEPFTALRRKMQLDCACFHLRRGASVKEAARACGFRDPAYFCRVFTRRFGVPPSRWGGK